MSTSFYGSAIIGISLSDVYTYEVKDETKTKYNEDTGSPYEFPLRRLYSKFGNKVLPVVNAAKDHSSYWSRRDDEFQQDFSFLKEIDERIDVHVPGGLWRYPDYAIKKGIVGIEVATDCLSRDKNKDGVSLLKIVAAFNVMRELLDRYGCSLEVKLFSQADGG